MFKVAICEDNKNQQNDIRNLIKKKECLDIEEIVTFDSGEMLVGAYKNDQRFSIILLDIQMDELDGIATAEIIRKYDKKVIIIIITSILEYAVEGYTIDAFDFILKPIDEAKFSRIIDKALKKLKEDNNKVYVVHFRDTTKLVRLSDIIYFESAGKYIELHCVDEIILNTEGISLLEKKLVDDGFVRISRFYLLNMKYIKEIKMEYILLKNNKTLKYSDKLKKNIKESYMNYMMGEL